VERDFRIIEGIDRPAGVDGAKNAVARHPH
jgi:hypothetical protein